MVAAPRPDPTWSVPIARPRLALGDAFRRLADAVLDPGPFDPSDTSARDPELIEAVLPLFERIAHGYLQLAVEGREHLRAGTPALYVGNHNGGILGPDLFCTLSTLWRELGPDAPLHPLAHDFAMRRLIPLGRVLARFGALRADSKSAARALDAGASVLVYPGGDLDAFRPFWRRDHIIFGARTGFVRLARDAGVPIVPIVAHGAHRSTLIFHEGEWLAEALGLRRWSRIERFPLALALPWGFCAGPWVPYLPLPFPIRLRILEPIDVPRKADLRVLQGRVVRRMQAVLNAMAGR